MSEEDQNIKGIARSAANIGNVYFSLEDYSKALNYYFKALKYDDKIMQQSGLSKFSRSSAEMDKIKTGVAADLGNIGMVFYKQAATYRPSDHNVTDPDSVANIKTKLFSKALNYHFKALKLNQELRDQNGIANNIGNIAIVYDEQNDYFKALDYYMRSLKMAEADNDGSGIARNLGNMAPVYFKLKKYKEAENCMQKAISISDSIGALYYSMTYERNYSWIDSCEGKYEEAFLHYKNYIIARDSISNNENTKKQTEIEMQYEFDKRTTQTKADQEKKDAVTRVIICSIGGGLLLVIILAGFIFRSYRHKRKANILITRQKEELEKQKELVEEKQKEILDSIHYAKRIQQSLLPTEKFIERNLKKTNS